MGQITVPFFICHVLQKNKLYRRFFWGPIRTLRKFWKQRNGKVFGFFFLLESTANKKVLFRLLQERENWKLHKLNKVIGRGPNLLACWLEDPVISSNKKNQKRQDLERVKKKAIDQGLKHFGGIFMMGTLKATGKGDSSSQCEVSNNLTL